MHFLEWDINIPSNENGVHVSSFWIWPSLRLLCDFWGKVIKVDSASAWSSVYAYLGSQAPSCEEEERLPGEARWPCFSWQPYPKLVINFQDCEWVCFQMIPILIYQLTFSLRVFPAEVPDIIGHHCFLGSVWILTHRIPEDNKMFMFYATMFGTFCYAP